MSVSVSSSHFKISPDFHLNTPKGIYDSYFNPVEVIKVINEQVGKEFTISALDADRKYFKIKCSLEHGGIFKDLIVEMDLLDAIDLCAFVVNFKELFAEGKKSPYPSIARFTFAKLFKLPNLQSYISNLNEKSVLETIENSFDKDSFKLYAMMIGLLSTNRFQNLLYKTSESIKYLAKPKQIDILPELLNIEYKIRELSSKEENTNFALNNKHLVKILNCQFDTKAKKFVPIVNPFTVPIPSLNEFQTLITYLLSSMYTLLSEKSMSNFNENEKKLLTFQTKNAKGEVITKVNTDNVYKNPKSLNPLPYLLGVNFLRVIAHLACNCDSSIRNPYFNTTITMKEICIETNLVDESGYKLVKHFAESIYNTFSEGRIDPVSVTNARKVTKVALNDLFLLITEMRKLSVFTDLYQHGSGIFTFKTISSLLVNFYIHLRNEINKRFPQDDIIGKQITLFSKFNELINFSN